MTTLSIGAGNGVTKTTIHDVAKLAGVSIKTVSRVVNMEPNVRQNTIEKVQAAINALNYRPNVSARSLASNRSYLILLLYDNSLMASTFAMQVQAGILPQCRKEGYELLIHPEDWSNKGLRKRFPEILKNIRMDGAILIPPISDDTNVLRTLEEIGKPYVRMSPARVKSPAHWLHLDNYNASALMVKHLIALGHKRIAYIEGPASLPSSKQRKQGFIDAMENAGLPLTSLTIVEGKNTFESGLKAAAKLLGQKKRPTAIFANNDEMASATMGVAHQKGIEIPAQLSVAGFDDSPLASKVWPPLTTLRNPASNMAEKAINLLIQQLRDPTLPVKEIAMEAELIVRESTGPASS